MYFLINFYTKNIQAKNKFIEKMDLLLEINFVFKIDI